MKNIIQIEGVSKIFKKNDTHALSDVSFTIEEGEFVALLGPNGAGKSTLINILGGNTNMNNGSIEIDGYNLEREEIFTKRSIGIVPQEVNFDDFFTVREVLMYQSGYFGIKNNEEYIDELLKEYSLYEHRNKNTHELSGGMRRRLLIVKALIHKPKICILDEPTAGVDIELKANLYESLRKLHKQGVTIILTTHYLEEAENLCKRIIIIDKGKIIADESKTSLMKRVGDMALLVLSFPQNVKKSDLSFIKNYSYSYENSVLEVSLPKPDIPNFLQNLSKNNLTYNDLKIHEEKLEDVFNKLVK